MKCFALLFVFVLVACSSAASSQIEAITAIPTNEQAVPATLAPTLTVAVTEAQPTEAAATAIVQAATATPLSNNLASGGAMEIAAATDAAMLTTPRNRVTFDAFPVALTFDEFYDGYNIRTGLILSDKLLSLDGQSVRMEGYMAPPLKPELDYFVLTRVRLAFCPFCTTAADWPDDIALIYLPDQTTAATLNPVRISGRIEVGASVDQETGMVSLVRIYADTLEILS
jgi:hypothetical protein